MRLDLADLHLFLCIAETGSITQGAARANLALASASERLRNIEANVGVTLLQRHARGIRTTEAGEAMAHHARLILGQQKLLKSELKDFSTGVRGTLHLYANTAALTEFLPQRLGKWLANYPQLNVDLKERTSTEIVSTITAGFTEAGIVSDAVPTGKLQKQPVARNHLVLIVPAGHRFEHLNVVSLTDVLDEPFVGLAPGNALQDDLNERAQAAGGALQLRIRMKTFEGLCEMVTCGIGSGIVPENIARQYQRRGSYRVLTLSDSWAQRQLCLCFRDWHKLSPRMQSLLIHLGATPTATKICTI